MSNILTMAEEAHALLCQLIDKHPLKYKTFNEGELLLQQGQHIHDVLWIELGQYSIDHTTLNGRQLSLGNYFAHDRLLGEIEFLTQSPCQFDIKAIESITVKVLPTSLLCEWLQQEPKIALWLSHSLSHNYQTTSSEDYSFIINFGAGAKPNPSKFHNPTTIIMGTEYRYRYYYRQHSSNSN